MSYQLAVIHGSPRKKGNTVTVTEKLIQELRTYDDIQITEHRLYDELPELCLGCTKCFMVDEKKCPHYHQINPILQSMLDADGIIITSPVYVLSVNAAVKNFLDHLGYIFMVHRPKELMFNKVGIIITTTVGAGTRMAAKNIYKSMHYWGLKRISTLGIAIYATNWRDIDEKRRLKSEAKIRTSAKQFYKRLRKRNELHPRVRKLMLFRFAKWIHTKFEDDSVDNIYWRERGWLN